MNKQYKIGVIAVVIAVLAVGAGTLVMNNTEEMRTQSSQSQAKENASMATTLSTLKGDAFDEAFINDMVEHHTGAVAMAKLVDTEAKNSAIQKLANDIITTQSKEITDMKSWSAKWGYDLKEPSQSAIDKMTANMVGKTGDELDKAFLEDMIGHHLSAIDMAVLTNSNAKHQEIKTLGKQIQDTQMAEIMLMRGYAKDAGYDIDTSGGASGGEHSNM